MNAARVTMAIAINTFRETVRDRVLYAFVLFALVITLMGILFANLSIAQDVRILQDLGLFTISTIGTIIAVFIGTNLVYKEIDKRTIYLIFTKPISRWQFIAGKYLGLTFCIFVVTFLMGVFLAAIIVWYRRDLNFMLAMFQSLTLIYLELLLVIALATFFSTFSTPLMSVLFTLSLVVIGHASHSLLILGKLSSNSLVSSLTQGIYYVLPDLASLSRIRSDLMYSQIPTMDTLIYLAAYIFGYIVLLLGLATVITEQREFQ